MVSSLLKVLSSGIQNERLYTSLTLLPFIKVWYKVSRFTTQWSRIEFNSEPDFGKTVYAQIPRKGHIVTRLFLVSTLPDIKTPQMNAIAAGNINASELRPHFGWTNSTGHALCEGVTLDIGGTRMEQLDSRLLEILDEFNTPIEKVSVVNRLIKRLDQGYDDTLIGGVNDPVTNVRVVVPLPFWFARGDAACALPIDAILTDEVRVGITFRALQGMYYTESRNINNTSTDQGASLWPLQSSLFYKTGGSTIIPGLVPGPGPVELIEGVQMPARLSLGDTYLLAEYAYLDQPEANRLRIADIQVPIVQHYALDPHATNGVSRAIIDLNIPNPTRDLFWIVQRKEAPAYNAHFLATRDMSNPVTLPIQQVWWPDAHGLNTKFPEYLTPGFVNSNSEPIKGLAIVYNGSLVRVRTEDASLFRTVLPTTEQKKTPWVNGFYYNFPFGIQNGKTAFSKPRGEANLDKIQKREIYMEFRPFAGCTDPNSVPSYNVYVWAETYNILRIYAGRAAMLFAY
jgi:Major capsid protein N-terminus/Large eukaryotic DNA virus major capsid protein